MGRLLIDHIEVDVAEDTEDILKRIVNSRDGLRHGSGAIVAPAGWVVLTAAENDSPIYVQVARIGYVRED
jgi:hypothetical protein